MRDKEKLMKVLDKKDLSKVTGGATSYSSFGGQLFGCYVDDLAGCARTTWPMIFRPRDGVDKYPIAMPKIY
jgi:bacteriocin-like protein